MLVGNMKVIKTLLDETLTPTLQRSLLAAADVLPQWLSAWVGGLRAAQPACELLVPEENVEACTESPVAGSSSGGSRAAVIAVECHAPVPQHGPRMRDIQRCVLDLTSLAIKAPNRFESLTAADFCVDHGALQHRNRFLNRIP